MPLVFVLPDWNAWRATVASLGLAFALTGWLALVSPSLAGILVALRLAALLLARPAPAVVTSEPPPATSSFSLARITRLQRTVESTRIALLGHTPRLKHHAVVRYWNLPLLSEVGFAGPSALRLWYGDSTLTWTGFGGEEGWSAPRDVLVEYDVGRPWPATVIESRAVALYLSAWDTRARGILAGGGFPAHGGTAGATGEGPRLLRLTSRCSRPRPRCGRASPLVPIRSCRSATASPDRAAATG